MILMTLDHARDFFSAGDSHNYAEPQLFLVRWLAHVCPTVFIFLAGTSAYLYVRRRTLGEASRFLLTRGLWLVLAIQLLVMTLPWAISPVHKLPVGNVIWAIGGSMIAMAALVWLPRWALIVFGVSLIAGHNLFDAVSPVDFGALGWLWVLLHEGGGIAVGHGKTIYVLYPLVPWIAVMAMGYALGPVFQWEAPQRRFLLAGLGLLLILGLIVLRAGNVYGDPNPWQTQQTVLATVLSFIDFQKYPPSLLYLMMTLAAAFLALAAIERYPGPAARIITVYGRVPLIYYIAHIYLLHALALSYVLITFPGLSWIARQPTDRPAGYGLGLPMILLIWVAVALVLYPLVHWFAAVKQRRRDWWLSYL